MASKLEPYMLTGKKLEAYRAGFNDGNEGKYFPAGMDTATYDWGHADGKKFGPRKGKPWTLAELLKLDRDLREKKEAV